MDTTADVSSAEATLNQTADTNVPEVVSDATANTTSVVTDTTESIGDLSSAPEEVVASETKQEEDGAAANAAESSGNGATKEQSAGVVAPAQVVADEPVQETVSNDIAELSYMLPNLAREYIMKEGLAEFLLDGDDLTDLPCRTVRNPGKPYADRFYEGEILFVAAKARYGGAAGFIKEMNKHARCFRANPLDPPPIRYIVLTLPDDMLRTARDTDGAVPATKPIIGEKLMQLFQEADNVCILFSQPYMRGFKTWGVMQTMPMSGYFSCALNADTFLSYRRLEPLYDDQEECMCLDGQELPPDLGELVVRGLADAVFDHVLDEKRRAERSKDRDRSRRDDRDRDRRDRDRGRDRRDRDRRDRNRGGDRSRDRDRERRPRLPPARLRGGLRERDSDRRRDPDVRRFLGERERDRDAELRDVYDPLLLRLRLRLDPLEL
eukprot:m.324738 g.324738  ORF g.324738 m.324738 type:complete len:437 (+) comp20374_c0_seq9:317-1627(+)